MVKLGFDNMSQLLIRCLIDGLFFTNDQINEMTRTVRADTDWAQQQTQKQRNGASDIDETANDLTKDFTDATTGLFEIYQWTQKTEAYD